jgi:hypothetical protein
MPVQGTVSPVRRRTPHPLLLVLLLAGLLAVLRSARARAWIQDLVLGVADELDDTDV